MRAKRLTRKFFSQPTLVVARELLGKFLVHKVGRKKIEAMITEVEAYIGPEDLASHASRGRTPRTEIMFGESGHAYVYMVYGMYHCLNFVTEKKDYPAAVLIRGAVINQNGNIKVKSDKLKSKNLLQTTNYKLPTNLNGPGKLCRYFQIDKKLNGEDITKSKKLWVEDRGIKIKPRQIKKEKRINIEYAGKYMINLGGLSYIWFAQTK